MDLDDSIRISLPKGEDMKKLIECPVCLEIPLPPIYLCRRGHIVCNFCQERTVACPLCRDIYTNTRSFVAEGIVEQCLMKCKYRDHGCQEFHMGGKLGAHLKVCEYRPLRCAECSGTWVLYGDYWNHLIGVHRINGVNQAHADVMYNFNFRSVPFNDFGTGSTFLWPAYFFKCFDNKIFFLRVRGIQQCIYAFLSFFGTKAESSNYIGHIEFASTRQQNFKVTWEGSVNHFRDDTIQDILYQGRGLIIPLAVIENNSCPENNQLQSWTYRVWISKLGGVGQGHNINSNT